MSQSPVNGQQQEDSSAYEVVFVRHGQSTWNKANRFIGWTDTELTEEGEIEARVAGQVWRDEGNLQGLSIGLSLSLSLADSEFVVPSAPRPPSQILRAVQEYYSSIALHSWDFLFKPVFITYNNQRCVQILQLQESGIQIFLEY